MTDPLVQRVHEKQLGMVVKQASDAQGLAGDVSWPGMVPLVLPEGAAVADFIRAQLLKIGEDIGDPEQFWQGASTGQVMQVFGALVRARMVAEAETELAAAPAADG